MRFYRQKRTGLKGLEGLEYGFCNGLHTFLLKVDLARCIFDEGFAEGTFGWLDARVRCAGLNIGNFAGPQCH